MSGHSFIIPLSSFLVFISSFFNQAIRLISPKGLPPSSVILRSVPEHHSLFQGWVCGSRQALFSNAFFMIRVLKKIKTAGCVWCFCIGEPGGPTDGKACTPDPDQAFADDRWSQGKDDSN
jgi:hypothetical protein